MNEIDPVYIGGSGVDYQAYSHTQTYPVSVSVCLMSDKSLVTVLIKSGSQDACHLINVLSDPCGRQGRR